MRYLAPLALGIAAIFTSPFVSDAASNFSVPLGDYAASNTNDAQVGYATLDLSVIPVAQAFTVDTCDAPTGTTYLRIVDDADNLIAAGTGGCPNGGTKLSAVSTATRRYYVRAGCAGDGACSGNVTASSNVGLIERWAPVLFQDTWPGNFFVPGDYITNFNFDGDYDGSNNYNHGDQADVYPFEPYVYYSLVETNTHYFVGYYFFHPQDRSCNQHENDLEGILLAVLKTGLYGDAIAMETEAHGNIYQYVTPGLGTTESPAGTAPDGDILLLGDTETNPRSNTIQPMPYLMAGHPKVFSQSGGHGVFSCDDSGGNEVNCHANDGVVYAWQGGNTSDPQDNECANGKQESVHFDLLDACGYRLISLDDWGGSSTVADPAVTQGFWVLQNHICENCTFHSFTNFRGNGHELDGDPCGQETFCDCTDNSANPPWQWRDHDGVGSGDWLSDPARFFDIDFEGPEFNGAVFSHDYIRHPYYTHEVELSELRINRDTDLDGFTIDFVSAEVLSLPFSPNEVNAITDYHWFESSPALHTWYAWFYGGNDATGENVYSQPNLNRYYFTRQTQERLADGTFQNGGRSVSVGLVHELDTGAIKDIVTEELGPNDWFSGTCAGDDDSGCVGQRPYDYCRVQVNNFLCEEGTENLAGNLTFKLTRIRRPSAPPTAKAGQDQTVECASPAGTDVELDGSASSDPENDPLTYFWYAPGIYFEDPTAATTSGAFPLGITEVTLTVSDGTQEVSDKVLVTIADTTAPAVVVQLSPSVLTPPKHQLVNVAATFSVTDACDPTPTITTILTSLTSSEPDNGMGDGDTNGDIRGATTGTSDTSFQLRAERSGRGNGRSYTIVYALTDEQGNAGTAGGLVTVPR